MRNLFRPILVVFMIALAAPTTALAEDPGACYQTCTIEINFPANQCYTYCSTRSSGFYGFRSRVYGYALPPAYGYYSPPPVGYDRPVYGYDTRYYRSPEYGRRW